MLFRSDYYMPGEVYSLVDDKKEPHVPDVRLRNNDIVFVYTKADKTRRGLSGSPPVVLVLGEVSSRGFHQFGSGERFTMMNLMLNKVGLSPYANDKAVRVIRTDADGVEEEFRVNVREMLKEGDPRLDFPLQSGDRIIVPERGISLF